MWRPHDSNRVTGLVINKQLYFRIAMLFPLPYLELTPFRTQFQDLTGKGNRNQADFNSHVPQLLFVF